MLEISIEQLIQGINDSITTLNDEYGDLSRDVAVLKTQVAELMWWYRAIAVALIGTMIAQIAQIFKFRRNKNNK